MPATTIARLLTGAAVLAAAGAFALPAAAAPLPPGVVQLNPGEPCPLATLCLYQHYGRSGPAYGIGAGYRVDLGALPMSGGSAADNVSSWVNNTGSLAVLIDRDGGQARPLFPGQSLEEPPHYNDTVDQVDWAG